MADYEVSKLMWMGIVVALAASVFVVAKPQISSLTNGALNKVNDVAKANATSSDSSDHDISGNIENGFMLTSQMVVRPSHTANRWTEKGDYGVNGYYVGDNEGHYYIYAKDVTKPITFNSTISEDKGSASANDKLTSNNPNLISVEFMDPVELLSSSEQFFRGNANLEEIKGLDKIDTSKLTSMSNMFADSSKIKSLDLSTWKVNFVNDYTRAFSGMTSLESVNLSGWKMINDQDPSDGDNTPSGVLSRASVYNMFTGDTNLKSINFSGATLPNLSTYGEGLFAGSSIPNLETLDLSNADLTLVVNATNAFQGQNSLNTLKTSGVKQVPLSFVNQFGEDKAIPKNGLVDGITNTDMANQIVNDLFTPAP